MAIKVIDYDNLILAEGIFGLEIRENKVKVLELKRTRGKYSVVGFGQQEVEQNVFNDGVIIDKESLAEAIRKAREEARPKRIKTKYASVVLPDTKIFVRVVKFPAGMSKEEIREAVEWKAKDLIAMPLDKVYWDWHRLTTNEEKGGSGETEVLISAVEKTCADSYTDTLKLLDITPLYYDISGNAAARFLFKKDYSQKKALLVRIDRNSTTLSLFLDGGVRYQTIIQDAVKGGYGALVDFAAAQLKVDKARAENLILGSESLNDEQKALLSGSFTAKFDHLMLEIGNILDYYKQSLLRDRSKEKAGKSEGQKEQLLEIYLYGKGARVYNLTEFFEQKSLKVSTDVRSSSSVSPIVQFISRQSLLENLVLLGLSLRNLGIFKELRDINLVPKLIKLKYLQKSIYSNLYATLRIIFWNIFVITVILAFIDIIAFVYRSNVEKDLKSVENLAESPANIELREDIIYLNETAGQIDRLFDTQLDWNVFYEEISGKRGGGITYSGVLVSEDPEAWRALSGEKKVIKQKAGYDYFVISGVAQTREDLQRYVGDMRGSEVFDDIKMPISNYEVSTNIEFLIYGMVDLSKLRSEDAENSS